MTKLTPEQIEAKRDYKLQQLISNKERESHRRIEEWKVKLHEKHALELERKKDKIQRKAIAYINKKRNEYERKCRNEIRRSQGKQERNYKPRPLSRNKKLQFALSIAQENARLRDTNPDGYGYCITCRWWFPYEELAGGHGENRTTQGTCLRIENINAQCHTCNYTMWPRGNPTEKKRAEMKYRIHARKKRGDDRIDALLEHAHKSIMDPEHTSPSEADICSIIPTLIETNEQLRSQKSEEFRQNHKPSKAWRRFRENYFTPKERWLWEETK